MHEILSLRLENFLSFGDVEFDFERAGLVLVEGPNGSGKSGMIDGLLWCLFEETLRGYRHDQVVHRRVGEGCVASVRLRTDGEEWGVTRARKHKRLKNALTVDAPGFVMAGNDAAQEEIERRLGCSFKTFLSSVVFGQDRAYRFSSLTDAEQKKILDEVIGVERFAIACAAARKSASGFQAELEVVRRSLQRSEQAREEAEAEMTDLRAKHAGFEDDRRARLEAELEKLREVKHELNLTRKVANAPALKKAADAALAALAASERREIGHAAARADAVAAAALGRAKLEEVEAELRGRRKQPGRCPACGQKVGTEAGAEAVAELAARAKKARTAVDRLDAAAGEADEAAAAGRREIKEARQAMTDAQRAVNDGVALEAGAAARRRRRADVEERIAELENEVSPYAALAEKAEARRRRHDEEAGTHAVGVADYECRLRHAVFWAKAYGASGLRSLLVDSSLPLLNEEAARVSRVLTGGAIKIEFSALTEQKSGKSVDRFEVRVDNKDGAGDYAGNSSGERAKVDLCVGLALQRLVASRSSAAFDLAVFDEVFDHLDAASHEPVLEVLASLDRGSVFVVSHNEDFRAFFPSVITIKKEGGFSSVEMDH